MKKKRYLHYDYRMSFLLTKLHHTWHAVVGSCITQDFPSQGDRSLITATYEKGGICWLMGTRGSLGTDKSRCSNPIIKAQPSSFSLLLCWCYSKGGLLLEVTRWLPAAPDQRYFLGGGNSASTCTWSTALELSVFGSDWSGLGHMPTLAAGEGVSSACFSWQRKEGIVSPWKIQCSLGDGFGPGKNERSWLKRVAAWVI